MQREPTPTSRRSAFVALSLALVVSACGGGSESVGSSPESTVAPGSEASSSPSLPSPSAASSSTTEAAASPPPSPSGDASAPSEVASAAADDGLTGDPVWEEAAAGLDEPTAMLVDPRTGEDLVVELGGRIVTLDGTVVLDLGDRVVRQGERGFLDATATPDGDAIVVHYSGADDGRTVVARLPVGDAGALADPDDEQVLLELDQPAGNHNGGSVVFGPDGMLHVALGDGGGGNDAFGNGADPSTPLGAILRLDVTSRPGEVVVPDDNPFVSGERAGDGDERVWAHGLRNPWRIATDGDRWFVADVGQDAVEEVTVVPAASGPHDLGWPDWEGDFCRVDSCQAQPLPPVATLTHADGACSIIGMAVAAQPTTDDGAAFWTDFCDTRVWRLDASGEVVEDAALPDGTPAYALDVDGAGFVVALTTDGRVLRRTRT